MTCVALKVEFMFDYPMIDPTLIYPVFIPEVSECVTIPHIGTFPKKIFKRINLYLN